MLKKASKVLVFVVILTIAVPSISAMAQENSSSSFCHKVRDYGSIFIANLKVPYSGYIGVGFYELQNSWCDYTKPNPAPAQQERLTPFHYNPNENKKSMYTH